MTCECWEALKKLGMIIKSPLKTSNVLTIIDKDLLAITTYTQSKATNEASIRKPNSYDI